MSVTKTLLLKIRQSGAIKAQKEMDKLGTSVATTVKGMLGFAAVSMVIKKFGIDMAVLAAKAEGVEIAFKRLAHAGLLKDLREATRGAASDLELMQNAVRASNFGIPLTELATLLEFAQRRARETGESVEFLSQSIVMGIGRKSPLILDNLGLNVVRVREEFKRTGDMAKAVAIIAVEELSKMDDGAQMLADDVEGLSAQWTNLSIQWGKILAPVVKEITKDIKNLGDGIERDIGILETYKVRASAVLKVLKKDWTNLKFAIIEWKTALDIKEQNDFNDAIAAATGRMKKHKETIAGVKDEYALWAWTKEIAIAEAEKLAGWQLKFNLAQIDQAKVQRDIAVPATKQAEAAARELKEAWSNVPIVTEEASESVLEYANFVQGAAQQMASAWSQALLSQWNEGQNFFENMKTGFEQMIASMVASLLAKAAIFGIFSMFSGGSALLGGSLTNFLGFGGGKAKGGPVYPNEAYLVGEQGPELFVPKERGDIVSNMTLNFNGAITDRNYVQRVVIPQIQRAQRLNN